MRCLRQVLRVAWTAKRRTNGTRDGRCWKRNTRNYKTAKNDLLPTHTEKKCGGGVPWEIFNLMQGTTPGSRARGRPRTTWLDGRWADEKGRRQSTVEDHCSRRGQPSYRGRLKTRRVLSIVGRHYTAPAFSIEQWEQECKDHLVWKTAHKKMFRFTWDYLLHTTDGTKKLYRLDASYEDFRFGQCKTISFQ